MTPLVVSAGTEVCRQGENGDVLCYSIWKDGGIGKELEETPILKALLGSGHEIRRRGASYRKPRSATVKAVEESLLLCLNQKTLRSF